VLSKPSADSFAVGRKQKGLNEKEFVDATLLDIKGAFDHIKPSAIIKAMRKQGVRPKVCNIYHHYLTNRRCSCTLSDKIVVAILIMGSPQAGLLSPSCGWNCAMNELLVDARQRNERNARMGAAEAETGWLQVGALSGSADFTGKLNISTLRLKGRHFVYEKAVPNKPQNKKHSIQ
jgi:hypothetical protein